MKIIIMGGGLGGLAAAHHLLKIDAELDIRVYEKNSIAGGECRGRFGRGKEKSSYSEYCWHAIGKGYLYLIDLLEEIKISENETTADHMVPVKNYWYFQKNKPPVLEENKNWLTNFSIMSGPVSFAISDYISLAVIFAVALCLPEKLLERYARVSWEKYCANLSLSAKRWFVDSTSIYMGMDYRLLDTFTIFRLLRNNVSKELEGKGDFYFLDEPYNDAWFSPWAKGLQKGGVSFHFGSKISSLEFEGAKIKSLLLSSGERVEGDIFINGMDIYNFSEIYPDDRWKRLSNLSYQIQEQVTMHFEKKIAVRNKTTEGPSVFILPDSPWFLMIRHESTVFTLEGGDTLAAGIGIWDSPGLNDKTARECTEEELAAEVWAQIKSSCGEDLAHEDGSPLEDPGESYGWHTYTYDENKKRLVTDEPKFSNNIHSRELRPETKDKKIENLWHSAAYVKTDTNIFCMESAAEAGAKCANSVADSLGKNRPCEVKEKEKRGAILTAVRKVVSFFHPR